MALETHRGPARPGPARPAVVGSAGGLARGPAGRSPPRHLPAYVVRFVRVSNRVLAIKEIKVDLARREYDMLRNLERLDLPCVEPFGVVSGRRRPTASPSTRAC